MTNLNGSIQQELMELDSEEAQPENVTDFDNTQFLGKFPSERNLLHEPRVHIESDNAEWIERSSERANFRILMTGNDSSERQTICSALSRYLNYVIDYVEAGSGRAALRIVEREEIDLIILEDELEDMTSLEFLYLLSRKFEKHEMPVIEIFHPSALCEGVQAMRLGVRDYLLRDAEGNYLKLLLIIVLRILADKQRMNALHEKVWMRQAATRTVSSVVYNLSLQGGRHEVYIGRQISELGMTQEKWGNDPELHHQMCYGEDRELVKRALESSYRTGEAFECEYRIQISGTQLSWFHDEAEVVADRHGRPLFMQGVMTDISRCKSLETELGQYRYMLDRMVRQRTEQLERRVGILESCNSRLCRKIGKTSQMYFDLLHRIPSLVELNGGAGT